MKTVATIWKIIVTAIIGVVSQIFGVWNQVMTALAILIVLDVVTGYLRAFIQGRLSSKESFRGVARKLLIFILIAVAVQVDRLVGLNGTTRDLVGAFYCASEGLSILENVVAAGLPVPEFLRNALHQIKEQKFEHVK